jgi:hypothetical protein
VEVEYQKRVAHAGGGVASGCWMQKLLNMSIFEENFCIYFRKFWKNRKSWFLAVPAATAIERSSFVSENGIREAIRQRKAFNMAGKWK